MRISSLLAVCFWVVFFTSCSIFEPRILEFKVVPDEITIGDSTMVSWSITDVGDSRIRISGIGDSLPANGSKTVSSEKNCNFLLEVLYKEKVILSEKKVLKVKEKIIEKKPVVKAEVNNSESKYLRGLIPYEEVKKNNALNYDIFSFDKTNFPDEIKLYLTVSDNKGNFVANLASPYGDDSTSKKIFRSIVESVSGKQNVISDFSVKEFHDDLTPPYSFSLVLDHSGSMEYDIQYLEKAAFKFFSLKKPEDKVSVFKFDNSIIEEVPLTNDLSVIQREYKRDLLERFGHATALYAAGDVGLQSIKNEKDKILVLFTDGLENSSFVYYFDILSYKPSQLVYKAINSNARIFTVGIGSAARYDLEKIAFLTDGKSYYQSDGKEIEKIFEELPRIFKNYYVITYKPSSFEGVHHITVVTNDKDGRETNVSDSTYIGKDISSIMLDLDVPQAIAFFRFGDSNLDSIFIPNIDKIKEYLKKNPNSKIKVNGHSDSKGTVEANMKISKKRAMNVGNRLIQAGIEKKRITITGYGFTQPLWNPEEYDYQAIENRRVDILITD